MKYYKDILCIGVLLSSFQLCAMKSAEKPPSPLGGRRSSLPVVDLDLRRLVINESPRVKTLEDVPQALSYLIRATNNLNTKVISLQHGHDSSSPRIERHLVGIQGNVKATVINEQGALEQLKQLKTDQQEMSKRVQYLVAAVRKQNATLELNSLNCAKVLDGDEKVMVHQLIPDHIAKSLTKIGKQLESLTLVVENNRVELNEMTINIEKVKASFNALLVLLGNQEEELEQE